MHNLVRPPTDFMLFHVIISRFFLSMVFASAAIGLEISTAVFPQVGCGSFTLFESLGQ
jgi:hypothetical protein